MRTCPSCKELNTDDSYYCHSCGRKLKGKTNGWIIISMTLLIILCIVSVLLYDSYDNIDYLRRERYYSENRVSDMEAELSTKENNINNLQGKIQSKDASINNLTNQIQSKDNEISNLQDQIQSQNAVISNLQNRLPQTYYTKYPNQKIYYWAGSFLETTYTWSNAGAAITIYMQKDGYGMTEWGWVPMNCLRK